MEDKIRLQSIATKKHYQTVFEVLRELEEKRSEEALVLVQKNTFCYDVKVKGKKRECCKDKEGRERKEICLTLETLFSLSRVLVLHGVWYGRSELGVFEEEKDMDATTSKAPWIAVTRVKEKELWSLEQEGEAETPEAISLGREVKGVSVNPEGESRHRHVRAIMHLGTRGGESESKKESYSGGI